MYNEPGVIDPLAMSRPASKAEAAEPGETKPLWRSKSHRVTVYDIARQAGVQQASVSVVLNGAKSNTHVSADARERILAVAEQLGYKRNGNMALGTAGRFGCIALLQSTNGGASRVSNNLWRGITDGLSGSNVHLSVFRLPDEDMTDEARAPKILREWMADGMLIDYTHAIPPKLKALVDAYALPAIWVNSQQEFDCVNPDDYRAGMDAAELLLKLGHKQIAYVNLDHHPTEGLAHYSSRERLKGYIQAMNAAGQTPMPLMQYGVDPRDRLGLMTEWFRHHSGQFTAVVTHDSRNACPTFWAADRAGLSIPRDLSVVNIGVEVESTVPFYVTCFGVPDYEVGMKASEVLLEKIEQPSKRMPAVSIPFPYLEGNTIAPL